MINLILTITLLVQYSSPAHLFHMVIETSVINRSEVVFLLTTMFHEWIFLK
jgi:hypothetical protein